MRNHELWKAGGSRACKGNSSLCESDCGVQCLLASNLYGSGCCGGNMNDDAPWCRYFPGVDTSTSGQQGDHKVKMCVAQPKKEVDSEKAAARCADEWADSTQCDTDQDNSIDIWQGDRNCSGREALPCETNCAEMCQAAVLEHGPGCCGGHMDNDSPWCRYWPRVTQAKRYQAAHVGGIHKTMLCRSG